MRKETCHEKKFDHFWQRNVCEHKLPHVLHARKTKKEKKIEENDTSVAAP